MCGPIIPVLSESEDHGAMQAEIIIFFFKLTFQGVAGMFAYPL